MTRKRKPDPGAAERMRKSRARRRAERELAAADLARLAAAGPQLPLPGIAPPERRPVPLRQAELQARILAVYPTAAPVVQWAEIVARPVELLARQLQCSRLEAHQEQEKARERLALYLHQKMPLAIQSDGPPIAPIHLHIGGLAGGSSDDHGLVVDVVSDTPAARDDDA